MIKSRKDKRAKIDKTAAFMEYKQTEGAKGIEETILQCRKELNASKDALKAKTQKINVVKGEIDKTKSSLEEKEAKKREKAFHA